MTGSGEDLLHWDFYLARCQMSVMHRPALPHCLWHPGRVEIVEELRGSICHLLPKGVQGELPDDLPLRGNKWRSGTMIRYME